MKARKALILCMALAVVLCILTGCFVKSKGVISSYSYDLASKYNIGNASVDASNIKEIDVDWISGSVKVVYGRVRAIEFAETSKSTLSESEQLRWMVDGDKLRIKFMKSGFNLTSDLYKDLVITVPDGVVFKQVSIDTVSSDSEIRVNAQRYDINNVSGDVELSCDLETKFDMDTVSGDAYLSFAVCPSDVDMNSVSGGCTLRIPANSGFRAKTSTVSGKINCSIPATVSGSNIEAGDGKADFNFSSVSGDLRIEAI